MTTIHETADRLMRDPEYRAALDALGPQFRQSVEQARQGPTGPRNSPRSRMAVPVEGARRRLSTWRA
jgi:hypothetical protein